MRTRPFGNTCRKNRRRNSRLKRIGFATAHEASLLDQELLRRDEIWFAERDVAGATRLYSLRDLKVRKDLEIRKHYLRGRFGAGPRAGELRKWRAE